MPFGRPTLQHVMWCNGNKYFCVLGLLKLADLILDLLSTAGVTEEASSVAYIGYFHSPIATILTSRFMLDLLETNAGLEGGNISTLGEDVWHDSAGSLSMPRFVAVFGGPLDSFEAEPDDASDDMNMERAMSISRSGRLDNQSDFAGDVPVTREAA
ncbi:hypothetical protein C8Q77DRAFT_1158107 [Trametes polyzona]|nr:hypothetical protein C8Q77DRAFT_1158107 [Trametes polyzona]